MKGAALRKWKSVPSHGEIIKDIFLPIKTPFDNTNIAEEHQFTVQQFIEIIKNNEVFSKHKVGLVIDLTKTDRYYDKKLFESNGIEHFKFPCRGFDETPDEDDTRDFINKCKSFLKSKPGELIVVHCTHGCNRTGFLIAAYLIDIIKIDALEAIKLFNDARPPGIHKKFVIEEILSRYGNKENVSKHEDFLNDEIARMEKLKLDVVTTL